MTSRRTFVEAATWADRHDFGDTWVVILGLGEGGTGEHVLEFCARNPGTQITVLEMNPQLVTAFLSRTDMDFTGIEVRVPQLETFASDPLCLRVFEELPPVLCFEPGFQSHRSEFERLFRLLTGRSREGLEMFLKLMGSTCEVGEVCTDGKRLLTMKDLGFVVDADKMGHPGASAVRILRELLL